MRPLPALQREARFGAAFVRRHGWRLLLLFAGVLLPLWGFSELAEEVREAEIFPFDQPILLAANALALCQICRALISPNRRCGDNIDVPGTPGRSRSCG